MSRAPLHPLLDRRQFLSNSATALGSIALASMLGRDGLLAAPAIDPARPYAPDEMNALIGTLRQRLALPT